MRTVMIAEHVSKNLGLRALADRFMDYVEALPENEVTISFLNVESISRSFAHQYWTRKKQSKKIIHETHMSEFVQKMLEVVKNPKKPKPFFTGTYVVKKL